MDIRAAILTDYPIILTLHIDSIKNLCSGHYSKKYISEWVETRKIEHYRNIPGIEVIVGEDEGKIIGFCRLDIKERCLTGLFIAPGYTEKKYGKQLLYKMEDIARTNDIEELFVYSSLNAVDFYHHMGYEGTIKKMHKLKSGAKAPAVKMSKKLI